MAFFTDKWVIANINGKKILLVRSSKKGLILEEIVENSSANKIEFISRILEEYDATMDGPDNIYIIYQDLDMHLVITAIRGSNREDIKLTSEPMPELYNLYISVEDNNINIIYIVKLKDPEKFSIYHHYYKENKWDTFIVSDIIATKLLNPIKVVKDKKGLKIIYINRNKEICISSFDFDNLVWSEPVKLVDNEDELVYLDMIIIDEIYHIVYCQYIDYKMVIKYEKIKDDNEELIIYNEEIISNTGSPSYPTLLLYENKLWVVWIDSDKIYSRKSIDEGKNWGSLLVWQESRNIDLVRYKYLTLLQEKNTIIDYTFGSIHPEIRFLGFGPEDKAREVATKKKDSIYIPNIGETDKEI